MDQEGRLNIEVKPSSAVRKQDGSIMGVGVADWHSSISSFILTICSQTNDSSIVSKRSVERLYFANEPHFHRYFVKKPQRRSPLINRGYWLRMRAIGEECLLLYSVPMNLKTNADEGIACRSDHVVHQFLELPSPLKPKIIINLGCG